MHKLDDRGVWHPCSVSSLSRMSGRGAWLLVSLTGIALSCVGAIVLPHFDILAAIMGALGNLIAAYALPALFVLVRNSCLKQCPARPSALHQVAGRLPTEACLLSFVLPCVAASCLLVCDASYAIWLITAL